MTDELVQETSQEFFKKKLDLFLRTKDNILLLFAIFFVFYR
ncbi:unnamed protein product [Schistosoma margrebowiei]|uniref:Uncharacterized protein n=1 Tax=Schistosoma margrebowiei TaxID=48269 RepID=A0A3P8A966_9TREM|nr:unnamed protein product [Schistosoma margrebowiei]